LRPLVTVRLVLEPQVAAHADAMFAVLADPRIYEFENAPPPTPAWLRERYARLESRRSADGREQWLNWVLRRDDGELIGYVQATVHADGRAAIAYELNSRYWGRGLAHEAVGAMIGELATAYGVRRLSAVFKRDNVRSRRLLERLDFRPGRPDAGKARGVEADEDLLLRDLPPP
jgi:RimJ/RimL family protein N-acetyltransferase